MEKNTIQEIREGGYEEFRDALSSYSDRELEMILEMFDEEMEGTNVSIEMGSEYYQSMWGKIYDEPLFSLQQFCSTLNTLKRKEAKMPSPISITSYPMYAISRFLLYLYDSVTVGKIKSVTKEVSGGGKVRKIYEQYRLYLHSVGDCPFLNAVKSAEFRTLIVQYVEAFDNLQCSIDPREAIEYLSSTNTGKSFLPAGLIEYFEDKQKTNTPNTSQTIPMPYIPTPSQKEQNRSGSKINPEKHEKTNNACQKAWKKIQKDGILDLNFNNFSEIASDFLGQGESLVSTVSRAFYKEEVSQEYKAGAGRKSK